MAPYWGSHSIKQFINNSRGMHMKYLSVFYSKHILKTPFFLLAYGIIALIFMAFNLALDYGDIEHTNYIVRFVHWHTLRLSL